MQIQDNKFIVSLYLESAFFEMTASPQPSPREREQKMTCKQLINRTNFSSLSHGEGWGEAL